MVFERITFSANNKHCLLDNLTTKNILKYIGRIYEAVLILIILMLLKQTGLSKFSSQSGFNECKCLQYSLWRHCMKSTRKTRSNLWKKFDDFKKSCFGRRSLLYAKYAFTFINQTVNIHVGLGKSVCHSYNQLALHALYSLFYTF